MRELLLLGMLIAGAAPAGFLDMAHKPDGAKYVVFVPHGYDGTKEYPAILFLHGSGQVGSDGKAHVAGMLAKAIREREKTFAFVAVFPQAQHGSWEAGSKDGRRALAILDEVMKEYKVDPKRVYLTGPSMGGEGTWSLAAAHPTRWAAIVPLCGGGDPKSADKLKAIPCWCFHGDDDRMIPPEKSREMIRAIKKAGGKPLYQEYPGVGHNCWDRAYANPDLYEWLLEQRRK